MSPLPGGSASAPHSTPLVGVLILTWRHWRDALECLESVLRQDYAAFQVVVCDNASGDGTLDRIREWAEGSRRADMPAAGIGQRLASPPVAKPLRFAEYTREVAESGGDAESRDASLVLIQTGANLGFAGGNNVGLRFLARRGASYAWLLNADTVVAPDALSAMVAEAEREKDTAMVGSKLLHYRDPGRIQAVAGGTLTRWKGLTRHLGEGEPDAGQWSQPLEPDFITGASLLARMQAVAEIGEMSEEYFLYSEEVDWCLRARRRGWRLSYSPEARVWHKGGASIGYGSPAHDYHSIRSALLLVRKFYPAWLPVAMLYLMYRGVAPKVVRGQFGRLRAALRAFRDFLTGSAGGPQ